MRYFVKLTMNSQHVCLNDILISNCVTSIISGMYQLYFCQIKTAIVEHSDLSNEKSYCWFIVCEDRFVLAILFKKLFIIIPQARSVFLNQLHFVAILKVVVVYPWHRIWSPRYHPPLQKYDSLREICPEIPPRHLWTIALI